MKNLFFLMLMIGTLILAGCSSSSSNAQDDDVITMVWYPNESGTDMKSSRDAIGAIIEEAIGKKVEHQLTTDYAIAIETIANNNAALAFMGAQGYIDAKNRNDAIEPMLVASGESGTLDDAIYHSWLAINAGEEENYKVDGEFSIETIANKKISFVSNSSTSGFKVPASSILTHFTEQEKYKDLKETDLMEGGTLFSQVLFGNSHQGTAVNLLNKSADVAAFCDSCVENYVEILDGEENTPSAVYQVKEDAAEPFQALSGKQFTLMNVTPVLNAPFVANMEVLSQEDFDKIQEVMTSDEVANNEEVFVPEDSGNPGLYFKSANERFVPVEDNWFDPIRELTK